MGYIQAKEYYLAIKRNEVLIHVTIWPNLENMLKEGSQTQNTTNYMILYLYTCQGRNFHKLSYEEVILAYT